MSTYLPTIGIEVHAELKTKTKMFCGSRNAPHESEPNIHVCPICMGHPGTLPTLNKEAMIHVLKVGRALKGMLASYSEFDRKNYFYPDIPKGYQISQYAYPLVSGGSLRGVAITRVHLEEDTARSLHDVIDGSIVDFNRAGVPLMELVTEPVIHSAKDAADFAKELQLLLRTLGVSDANMERGEMRVEANISVSKTETFGTKVEVKNLNSFKSVEQAILYEVARQSKVLDEGGTLIQETRGWDEIKQRTYSQRIKESASEYRYFPDPDLPKVSIDTSSLLSRVDEEMVELPEEKRIKYSNIGLPIKQVDIIISDIEGSYWFETVAKILNFDPKLVQLAANYYTTDLISHINENVSITNFSAINFVEIVKLLGIGKITSRVAKDILVACVVSASDPHLYIEENGLLQDSSEDSVREVVIQILNEHDSVATELRDGKEAALQFLIGQGMKLSKGKANPQILSKLFLEEVKKV